MNKLEMNKNKWPIYECFNGRKDRIFKTSYINRELELIIDTGECKACRQCAKACPKDALIMPLIPKGKKVKFIERLPIMPDPSKCVFCGICMFICPFNAISMKIDGKYIKIGDLQLKKGGILPEVNKIKIRKVELANQNFSNPLWNKLLLRIQKK